MTNPFRPDPEQEEEGLQQASEHEESLRDEVSQDENSDAAISRLRASPEEEAFQSRLRMVDQLLARAPLVKPSVEFAERVLDRIRKHRSIDHQVATGMAIGMGAASIIITTILTTLLIGIVAVIVNWTSVYQWLVTMAGIGTYINHLLFEDTSKSITDSPILLTISIFSIPLMIIWIWIMRRVHSTGMKA